MNFDPKTTKLHEEEVDEHLTKYGVRLSPEIKVEFCPQGTEFSLPPLNDGVYMHPQILALGLKMPLTKFFRSILPHYRSPPRSCQG